MADFAWKVYSSGQGDKETIPSKLMAEHDDDKPDAYKSAKATQRKLQRQGHRTFIEGPGRPTEHYNKK